MHKKLNFMLKIVLLNVEELYFSKEPSEEKTKLLVTVKKSCNGIFAELEVPYVRRN